MNPGRVRVRHPSFTLSALFLLASCAAEPLGDLDPDPVRDDRLRTDSTLPAYVERVGAGTMVGFAGAIRAPDAIPADPESRAAWFLAEYGAAFGVDDAESDVVVRDVVTGEEGTAEETDSLVTFDRQEDGVPVYGSSVRVEVGDDGVVSVVVAQTPSEVSVDTTPTIPRATAIATARAAEPGTALEDASLVIFNEAMLRGEAGPSQLVWMVKLAGGGVYAPIRFVDAHTGELLAFTSTSRLQARRRNTWSASNTCEPASVRQVYDEGGVIAGATTTADATTAHALARRVWDFYWTTFRRDSHDGRGALMLTTTDLRDTDKGRVTCTNDAQCTGTSCGGGTCNPTVEDDGNRYCDWATTTAGACAASEYCDPTNGCETCVALENAYWDEDGMYYGEGMATLDIMGHEYTHGLVQETAGLVYQGESGALNESFADVIGQAIDGANWTIGENSPMGTFRDLSRPSAHHQPDHMDEIYTGTRDHGGVHINSGIPNYVAYLATEGGTHAHSNVEVRGIGATKVHQIWFRALTWYMTSGSTFEGAKIAIRFAAWKFAQRRMHGVTYRDCGAVLNAFGAVGIGSADGDEDCHTDAVDNCPTVYNPQQEEVAGCHCADNGACTDCSVNDGCIWCGDGTGAGQCMAASMALECMGDLVSTFAGCEASCGAPGEPCSGSGPDFDAGCCDDMICVVGACQPPEGGREQAACAEAPCAAGLACEPVGSAETAPTCCARDTDYCEAKEDCCGLMECVGNTCIGKNPGEACLLGDCIGASFCDAGTCT